MTMDSWSEKQIRTMEFGGNQKFNSFLSDHKTSKETSIHSKYISYGAKLYKERLNAELEGRAPPTEIAQEVRIQTNKCMNTYIFIYLYIYI